MIIYNYKLYKNYLYSNCARHTVCAPEVLGVAFFLQLLEFMP